MNSNEAHKGSPTNTVSLEFVLEHPQDKVWRALTDPALLSEWLLPVSQLKLEQDTGFEFKAPPQPGWDGAVQCRFLEIEPHTKLSFTWDVGGMEISTVVTFTLAATETGTRLSVMQTGFKPAQKRNFAGARYGWKMMGGRLAELLERRS